MCYSAQSLFNKKDLQGAIKAYPTTPRLVFKGLQLMLSLPIFGFFLVLRVNIVSSILCCGVGIVPCLFNLLYYVIWRLHPSSTPRTSSGSTYHANSCPTPSQEESLKVRYPSVCARRCEQDVLFFCPVICWWHPQIVSRVIIHVLNANLFQKWFVCHIICKS